MAHGGFDEPGKSAAARAASFDRGVILHERPGAKKKVPRGLRPLLPEIVRRYGTAASAGVTAVPPEGTTVPFAGGAGLIIALGPTSGYEYATSADGGAMWIPIAQKSRWRWQPNLSLRTRGNVTGELVLGHYPVCDANDPQEWEDAMFVADTFAGVPLVTPIGGSTSAQTTFYTDQFKEADPAYFDMTAHGAGPGVSMVVQNLLSNDPATLLWLSPVTQAPAKAGLGFPISVGGSFGWTGNLFLGCSGVPLGGSIDFSVAFI